VPAGYAGQPAKVRSVYESFGAVDPTALAVPGTGTPAIPPGTPSSTHPVTPGLPDATGTVTAIGPKAAAGNDGMPSPAVAAAIALLLSVGAGVAWRRFVREG